MRLSIFLATILVLSVTGCKQSVRPVQEEWMRQAIDVASCQLKLTAEEMDGTHKLPRSIYTGYTLDFLTSQMEQNLYKDSGTVIYQDFLAPNPSAETVGQRRTCDIYDWTSGFFPGSLWYIYELTGDEALKAYATKYTNLLNPIRKVKNTHDIGFMIYCSYGNALRLAPNDTIQTLLIETADNLSHRFNQQIGCIRSWDFGTWNYPVIIDNMMNLDLLFAASRLTGNNNYRDIATKHALTTMKNHFRPDYTCYHVVSYNDNGTVESKETHQGKSHDSSWARGQAWAAYGYTSCYRETKDTIFLAEAVRIADMIMQRVKTDDKIPYWDYDAPVLESTPRDASAAAVTASALLELSTLLDKGENYFSYAESILKSLSGQNYLAVKNENQGFILMHSTGSLPHGSEIDTPLNYADYYYLEALKRYQDIQQAK